MVNFEEAKALGDESHQILPGGRFVIVRLKTWFDPSTISEHRGDSPLAPGPRRVVLVDDAAHLFPESSQGKAALARLGGGTIPLSQSLRPGESYVTDLVFDVPANARSLRLFVGDTFDMPDRLLMCLDTLRTDPLRESKRVASLEWERLTAIIASLSC